MSGTWTPPKGYESRPVAVLGAGVLGRRIATCWISAGYTVNLLDTSEQQRVDALKYIEENIAIYVQTTRKTPAKAHTFDNLADTVKNAWFAIECVPEKLETKIDTFAELEALAPDDCILATNSSSYKSSMMIEKVSHATKTRILNTHYFMPPDLRAVELMTDGHTSPEIFPFLVARFQETGLKPCVARKESTGFIFNRLWAAIKREALTILSEGVSDPEQLDALWNELVSGSRGPCKLMDAVGLDTVAFIEENYIGERGLSSEHTVDFLRKNYLEQGKLGLKSSKGGFFPPASAAPPAPQSNGPRIIALDLGISGPVASMDVGRVLELSANGKVLRTLVDKQMLPDGIDVSLTHGLMFWTCMGMPGNPDGAVFSANLDGSDVKSLVSGGLINTPKQLVVEPVSQKLYFADREGLRIFRCNFDGSQLENLIYNGDWQNDTEKNDGTKWCVGITVIPQLGKFFWTQKGPAKSGKGRIFSANITTPEDQTATTRTDVQCILDNLPEPIDLEFHEASHTLYWTDRGELPFGNSLNMIQLDEAGLIVASSSQGSFKHEILARKFNEAIGLKLDVKNGHIYLTDLGGSIYRCNLDGSQKTRLFSDESYAFTGIALL